ncbi:MAG: hypothetical protein Q9196_006591 [Gyalolechia fulgens]
MSSGQHPFGGRRGGSGGARTVRDYDPHSNVPVIKQEYDDDDEIAAPLAGREDRYHEGDGRAPAGPRNPTQSFRGLHNIGVIDPVPSRPALPRDTDTTGRVLHLGAVIIITADPDRLRRPRDGGVTDHRTSKRSKDEPQTSRSQPLAGGAQFGGYQAGNPFAGFTSAGFPSGFPSAGFPSAGFPSADAPSAGAPSAGVPSGGIPPGDRGSASSVADLTKLRGDHRYNPVFTDEQNLAYIARKDLQVKKKEQADKTQMEQADKTQREQRKAAEKKRKAAEKKGKEQEMALQQKEHEIAMQKLKHQEEILMLKLTHQQEIRMLKLKHQEEMDLLAGVKAKQEAGTTIEGSVLPGLSQQRWPESSRPQVFAPPSIFGLEQSTYLPASDFSHPLQRDLNPFNPWSSCYVPPRFEGPVPEQGRIIGEVEEEVEGDGADTNRAPVS